MGSRIKYLLEEVEFTLLKMKTLYQEIGEANRKGKKGKAQQLISTRRYLYKKLLTFKEKFNSIIKGSVCNIKYEYKDLNGNEEAETITSEALLVNVNDEEIVDILKLYCKFRRYQFIRILEIQRIPTNFC